MSKNKTLSAAKSVKNDEFYTQYNDIQKEINAYLDYDPDTFRGKTVLLPCDDPEGSNFTRFFAQNFEMLGLKKLISTSYAAASKKIGERGTGHRERRQRASSRPSWYQPSLFEQQSPQFDEQKTAVRGKIFVLDHDTNASGRIDLEAGGRVCPPVAPAISSIYAERPRVQMAVIAALGRTASYRAGVR